MKYNLYLELCNNYNKNIADKLFHVLKYVVHKPGMLTLSDNSRKIEVKCDNYTGTITVDGDIVKGSFVGVNEVTGDQITAKFDNNEFRVRTTDKDNGLYEYLGHKEISKNEDPKVIGKLNYYDGETTDYLIKDILKEESPDIPLYIPENLVDVLSKSGIEPDISILDESIKNDMSSTSYRIYSIFGKQLKEANNYQETIGKERGPKL